MDPAAAPTFEDDEVAASFAAARAAIQAALAATARTLTARDALAAEQEWEHLHRLIGAAQIDNVTAIDTGRLHRIDGHRSVKAHIGHVLKVSPEEAGRRAKAARALRALPDIAAALRAGRVSLCHVQVVARVQANPRIKDKVPGRQEKFLRWAAEESFDGFRDKVLDWERATDMNGGFKDNERNHANRNVRPVHSSIDNSWDLAGQFAADQGARAREILDHYIEAEWLTDWTNARARLGDAATVSDLKRTDAQRRADAFIRLCNDAAGAPPDTSKPAIVHNIVWSADTYLALADRLGADAAALDTHWSATLTDPTVQRDQWCDPDTYRCSTLDGVPLEPVEQFFSSLANHVRRVIVTTKGVWSSTSAAKPACSPAPPASPHSYRAPGASGPAATSPPPGVRSTTSTSMPRADPPTPTTAHPSAASTNRGNPSGCLKQKGFSATRDPVTGRWRTYRPDGSEIE